MKFCVPSKTFYSYASAVSKVINPKSPMTILASFLLTLKDDTLTITGSDVENSLSATIPVTGVEGEGSFCIDARRLVELLKEIPSQGLTVTIDPDLKVSMKYETGGCEFVAIDGKEYPQSSQEEDNSEPVNFSLPAQVMINGIEYTQFAAATEDYRPIMMGILFDVKPDDITFVATDTRKLAKYTDGNCQPGVTVARTIPPKPAGILRSVFAAEEDLQVTFTEKSATFRNSCFIFNCRFLQGVFPDYTRVIPRNNTLILTVDRLSLLNAVRRVGLFVSQEYGLEKFMLTPDHLELKSQDPNLMTQAHEALPCDFTGNQLVIGFSAPFTTEILNTIKTDDVLVYLSDAGRPGLFRPGKDIDNTELVILLMPMTVGEF